MNDSDFNYQSLNEDFVDILKHNYLKILCVNLKTKKHRDIFLMDKDSEQISYEEDIDKWLLSFADNSFVHKDDVAYYKQNTDINLLRDYFEKYDEPFSIMYRRLNDDEYKWAEMVIIKSNGYTKESPVVILYVMDAEKYSTPNALENQGIYDCFNIAVSGKGKPVIKELLKYVANFYSADDVYICDDTGNIIYEFRLPHLKSLSGVPYNQSSINENLTLIVVNPKEMKDYHLLYRCVGLIIFRLSLDEEIEHKYIIEKRQNRIINALSKRFFCIYRVDMPKNKGYLVYAPEYVKELLGNNSDATKMLEIVENNLVEEEYRERVHEFNKIKKWQERLYDKETVSIEYKGVNRWTRNVLIVSKRDDDNTVTEILYAVQDIEEQKIREAEQDFKLREALKIAKGASKAKSLFLSNMSHDIRTPMNAIVGFTDLAKDNIDNAQILEEYLNEISVASNHLLSLINEVLDMSRIESGKMELNEASCDITEILNNISHIMQSTIDKNGLSMELNMDSVSHKKVLCDQTKVNQILFNLIGNSAKYNKKDGYIKVSCKELSSKNSEEGIYEFTVEDSGIGMSKEFLGKIFDNFEREQDTLTSGIQGTGLGMAITKGLVELMNGTINIESEKNVGTTCVVTIPFTIIKEDTQKEDEIEGNADTLVSHLKDKKILLVDDNLINQKLAAAIFKKLNLYIDIEGDGKSAIKALEEHENNYYDIILMDMQMPVMDGLEATAAIRAHENKSICDIPIIIMTANVFEEDKKKSYKAGANGFVTKPIDVDAMVREMVRVTKGDSVLVNREDGLKLSYDSEELYNSIIEAYIEESDGYKTNLKKFLDEKNWKEYTVIAHAIKSNSKQIGANDLFEEALKMEMAGKSLDEAYILSNHDSFIKHYQEVLDYLQNE